MGEVAGWKRIDWKMTDWKLTDRKMTDGTKWTKNEGLTLTDRNLQDWKMTDKLTMAYKARVNVNSGQNLIAHYNHVQHILVLFNIVTSVLM